MKLFRYFLRRTIETACPRPHVEPSKPKPEITIGSKWIFKPDGDPFPSKYPPAEILDVKDGWVRYSMGPVAMSLFPDNRREIDSFLRIYEPYR